MHYYVLQHPGLTVGTVFCAVVVTAWLAARTAGWRFTHENAPVFVGVLVLTLGALGYATFGIHQLYVGGDRLDRAASPVFIAKTIGALPTGVERNYFRHCVHRAAPHLADVGFVEHCARAALRYGPVAAQVALQQRAAGNDAARKPKPPAKE